MINKALMLLRITGKKMNNVRCVFLMIFALSGSALADTAKTSEQCKVLDRSDAVIIMVCPVKDVALFQAAGKEACGLKQLCNVWIWDSETKAPGVAPISDADMPKVNAKQAEAIWINDSKSLMSIQQVKK